MTLRRKHHLFWLVIIVLFASLIRFNGMLSQSLWIDEGFTWNLTQYDDLFAILRQDVHPPLYFLMIDAWVDVAGTSILSMRYFSLLPSLLSVVVVYQLAREISVQRGDNQTLIPLIAAAVMAVAESETFLSQEARSYTWHVLFACLSMLGFLRWQRTEITRYLLLWIISTIALIYTFYLGAFVGVVQGLYALIFIPRKQKIWAIAALVLSAMTLIPWLALTVGEQSDNISRAEWIRPDAFGFWLDDFRTKYFTRQWALTITLMIAGLFTVTRKQVRLHPTGIILLLWFGVPLLLTLYLNEQVPTYQPRRVSQITPAIILLIALGIGHIQGRMRWILLGIIVAYGALSTDFWRYKQPWQMMVDDTVTYITEGTPMLFELGGDDYAPRYHYGSTLANSYDFLLDEGTPDATDNVLIGLTTWRNLQPERYVGDLPAIIDSQDHWWLFYWSSDVGALNWLDTFGFQRSATLTVDFNPDVYLYRYDRLSDNRVVSYENGLQLQEAIFHDDLTVELLWSTDRLLSNDYTMSTVLIDTTGAVVAQHDSMPFLGERPTSTWQVDDLIYDYKPMLATSDLGEEMYQVGLVVYQLVDGNIIRLNSTTGEDLNTIGQLTLNKN
ncbi:MAG: glycosyltransferase family 39 protein [Phototrophicaceae bacterium]